MSIGPEELGDMQFEERELFATLATANAIAERAAHSNRVYGVICAELTGVPYEEASPEEQTATYVGQAALTLSALDNPTRVTPLSEVLDASRGTLEYENQAKKLNERFKGSVDAERLRDVYIAITSELQASSGLSDEYITEEFTEQLAASKLLAEERGVDLATVYSDDKLYYEVAKNMSTLEDAASLVQKLVGAMTADTVDTALFQDDEIIKRIPEELRDELTQEQLDKMVTEFRHDPEFHSESWDEMESFSSILQDAMRQMALYTFIKTYGYDEVNNLAPKYKESLWPKMPLASIVAELIPFTQN